MLHPLYRVPLPDHSPKPYGFWGRTSSDRQKKFHTIEGQLEEWFEYCKHHDIDPLKEVHYFLDEGVKGAIPIWERPNGAVMREYIQGGFVTSYIITMYIDRTARDDVGSIYDIMDECEEYGINFHSINDGVDTKNEDADTHAGINAVFARANKRKQLKRMVAGKVRKAKQGYWMGSNSPYGHMTTPDNRLVINPAEAQIILDFWSLITTKRYSLRNCAAHAAAQGYPTPSGSGEWAHQTLKRILSSTSLYGDAEWNKDRVIRKGNKRRRFRRAESEIVIVKTDPILTKAQWDEMARCMDSNRQTYSNTGEFVENSMLPNLYCGECGSRYYPAGSKYKNARYYTYRHAWDKGKTCPQQSLYANRNSGAVNPVENGLDERVWRQFLLEIADLAAWRTSLESHSTVKVVDEHALAQQSHDHATAALEDLDNSFWRKRQLTRQQYDRLLPQLQGDVERAEKALAETGKLAEREAARGGRIDQLEEQLKRLRRNLDHATLAEQRDIINMMVQRVMVRDGKFKFEWLV